MGGKNPYITAVDAPRPERPFTVRFRDEETSTTREIVVRPEDIPFGRTGLEGSLLDIAFGAGLEIDHACGGVCACATCHVYVVEGLATCNKASADEEDQLDTARAVTTDSRLSCQCVPDGTADLLVTVPSWNKNFVKE